MKVIQLAMLFASASAISKQGKDNKEWEKYKATRGDHDCAINELNNWLGIQRCKYSWECQGARECTRPDSNGVGWCQGDSFCPEMGPLDYYDKSGDVKWNAGSGNVSGYHKAAEPLGDVSAFTKVSSSAGYAVTEGGDK